MEIKICKICSLEKTIDNFYKKQSGTFGVGARCKDCVREEQKQSRTVEYYSNKKARKYGITSEQFNQMFLEQEGKCKICGIHHINTVQGLHIDHCHDTGKVRGLLCFLCNSGLGSYKDNIEVMEKAYLYLLKHKQNNMR